MDQSFTEARYCESFGSHADAQRDEPYAFEKEPQEHSPKELIGLLRLQLDLQDKYAEQVPRSIVGLHRFFKIYVKGFPGANDLRVSLMNTKSTAEVREILADFERQHEEIF